MIKSLLFSIVTREVTIFYVFEGDCNWEGKENDYSLPPQDGEMTLSDGRRILRDAGAADGEHIIQAWAAVCRPDFQYF